MERLKFFFAFLFLASAFFCLLAGEIKITESVNQFRYPKFSDNGFVEWVLEGNSGTYSQSEISIGLLDESIISIRINSLPYLSKSSQ